MNKFNQEKLVLLISSGKNTYKDIKDGIPELPELELESMVNDIASNPGCIVKTNADLPNYGNVHFADADTFYLTNNGKDVLYQLQKEKVLNKKVDDSYKLNVMILIATVIGVILSFLALTK
ncbi:MAG: hypothetical protein LKF34_03585 [Acidaminococcaceae bacterium]|jgi:hypothetical protein|nr:hypothetical protein [Acidaminococcaceae bacterium]